MILSPRSPSTVHCAKDFVIITARGPCALALCWVRAELFPWVTPFPPQHPCQSAVTVFLSGKLEFGEVEELAQGSAAGGQSSSFN